MGDFSPTHLYKCIKLPIKNILNYNNSELVLSTINDAVYRTNIITTKACLLLRYWILNKYHSNIDLPIISENIISVAFKSLLKDCPGPKLSVENNKLCNEDLVSPYYIYHLYFLAYLLIPRQFQYLTNHQPTKDHDWKIRSISHKQ